MQKDSPVGRKRQIHKQNLMWEAPVRNPSADTSSKGWSFWGHLSCSLPAGNNFLTTSLSLGNRHPGTCIPSFSYEPLHCLKPESLDCTPCWFRLAAGIARHLYLWKTWLRCNTNSSLNPIKTFFLWPRKLWLPSFLDNLEIKTPLETLRDFESSAASASRILLHSFCYKSFPALTLL